MTDHMRIQIRERVASLLVAESPPGIYPTVAKGRVFPSRSRAFFESELPAIAIYTNSESAEKFGQAPREYRRTLQLVLKAVAKGEEPDKVVDNLARDIERVMGADYSLGDLVEDSLYTETEIELPEEGEQPIARARISFDVIYHTKVPDPADQKLDDFKKLQTEIDQEPADFATPSDIDSIQDIDIPQT